MTPTTIGKYEILEELGRGGFAVVYRARDTALDRVVALKVLHAHWATEPQFATRFRQEARAAAGLRHPNIVPVYDTGEADGQLYIAMAYLPGRTLHDRLEANGPLTLEQALPILEQLAEALDYAHGQGVVHRDVKPLNVMVEETARGPVATLMDFGLVKALESSTALTSQGTLLGSPEYMAPEQADPNRHAEIGPATDRYALGVLAYRMLAGRVPFPGNTPGTLNAHLNLDVPDPRRFVQDLPQAVIDALLTMLAKAPAARSPTACAFVTRLREAQEAEQQRRTRETRLAALYQQFQAAIQQKAWAEAVQCGQQIQAIDPSYGDLAHLLPMAQMKQQAAAAAQAAARAQQARDAQLTPLRVQLETAVAQQDWPEVLQVGGQIQALQPDDAEAIQWIAHARDQLRRSASRASTVKPVFTTPRPLPTWLKPVGIGLAAVILLGICLGTLGPVIWDALATPSTRRPATSTPTPVLTPTPVCDSQGCIGDTMTRSQDGMVMVYVPGGTFQMGSTDAEVTAALDFCNQTRGNCERSWFEDEQPVHTVTLDGFWLDQTEVINEQYAQCVASGVCKASTYADNANYNGNRQPVVGVDWHNATAYCQWAGAQLPTEAQREYAARGTEGRVYPWGNDFDGTKLNYCDKNCTYDWADKAVDDGYQLTAPVGSFPADKSWAGALDLAGNVCEWTADRYGAYSSGSQANPEGPATGDTRVVRGGSWGDDATVVRSTDRFGSTPTSMVGVVGFRCVVVRAQGQ